MKWWGMLIFAVLAIMGGGVWWVIANKVEWVARNEYPDLGEYQIGLGLPIYNLTNLWLPVQGVMADKGRVQPQKVQIILWDKIVTGCRQYGDIVGKRDLQRGMAIKAVGERELMVYVYVAPALMAEKGVGAETSQYVAGCLQAAQKGSLPEEARAGGVWQALLFALFPMRIAYAP